MTPIRSYLSPESKRRLVVGAGVILAHGIVFAVIGLTHPTAPPLAVGPIIDVELFQPAVSPPAPPSPAAPESVAGGGPSAAPSVIHTPPKPRPVAREVPAPPVKVPEQSLVVGVAPVATSTPGFGQGGQGTGVGPGIGSGDGPGTGGGPPRFIVGPSSRQIADAAPAAARRRRVDGMVTLRCTIRLDSRLENCRIMTETPSGMGFGAAAVRVATDRFRFSPPTSGNGQPQSGAEMPLGIRFNLGGRSPSGGPVEG